MDNQGAGKGTATNKSLQGKAKFLWPWQRPLPEFTTEKMIKAIHFWDIIPTISLNHQPVLQNLLARVTCEWWLLEQTAKWPASTSSKALLCWQERNLSSSSHYIRRKHVQQSPSTTNARLESQNKTHCTVTLFLPSRNLQAVKQLRWAEASKTRSKQHKASRSTPCRTVQKFRVRWTQ